MNNHFWEKSDSLPLLIAQGTPFLQISSPYDFLPYTTAGLFDILLSAATLSAVTIPALFL